MKIKLRYIVLAITILINLSILILSMNNFFIILFLKASYLPLFIFDILILLFCVKNKYLKYIFTLSILSIGMMQFLSFKLNMLDKTISTYKSKYIISEYAYFDRRMYTYTILDKGLLGFSKQSSKIIITIKEWNDLYYMTIEEDGNIIVSDKEVTSPQDQPEKFMKQIYPKIIEKQSSSS